MSDLERRLEDLFAEDSRARRVRQVRVAPHRASWPAAGTLIAAAAVLIILLLGTLTPGSERPASPPAAPPSATSPGTVALSGDGKSVLVGGRVALAIDDDQIVEWFRSKSQLCDQHNMTTTPGRRTFCENKASFRDQTRFASVVGSPDGIQIGLTIESATLSPDTVAGIFLRSTGTVRFLTSYYLDNRFIGFSPTGANFIYQGGCFEAKCGLFIVDSKTLAEIASLNKPDGGERQQNATFVRWISDNEVEYRLGTELRRHSF